MSKADAARLVGRAFRCSDGLIRWITHLSTRGYFSLLWRQDDGDIWYSGGIVKVDKWQGGEEVRSPRPGESYKLAGATGVISERTVC